MLEIRLIGTDETDTPVETQLTIDAVDENFSDFTIMEIQHKDAASAKYYQEIQLLPYKRADFVYYLTEIKPSTAYWVDNANDRSDVLIEGQQVSLDILKVIFRLDGTLLNVALYEKIPDAEINGKPVWRGLTIGDEKSGPEGFLIYGPEGWIFTDQEGSEVEEALAPFEGETPVGEYDLAIELPPDFDSFYAGVEAYKTSDPGTIPLVTLPWENEAAGGLYFLNLAVQEGLHNGKPYYFDENAPDPMGTGTGIYLFWTGERWQIGASLGSEFSYGDGPFRDSPEGTYDLVLFDKLVTIMSTLDLSDETINIPEPVERLISLELFQPKFEPAQWKIRNLSGEAIFFYYIGVYYVTVTRDTVIEIIIAPEGAPLELPVMGELNGLCNTDLSETDFYEVAISGVTNGESGPEEVTFSQRPLELPNSTAIEIVLS